MHHVVTVVTYALVALTFGVAIGLVVGNALAMLGWW
jgi:hypothetical protein